jgi:hypothetical protein
MLFSLNGFTFVHVALSLIGIMAGFVLVGGFLANTMLTTTNFVFVVTTILTSVTGLLFPFHSVLPSHIVSVVSLLAVGLALYAQVGHSRRGRWRAVFVVASLVALYLNVFVLVVQTFVKNAALQALAPTQTEWPFVLAQILTLAAFVLLGVLAQRQFEASA